MTLNELKNIGNKIVSIYYGRKESLAKIPVGKVFKEKDDYIVLTANQIRNKFMMSTQQIYYYGKKDVDFKVFKTATAAKKYIDSLIEKSKK
jgi:hypothetical protein